MRVCFRNHRSMALVWLGLVNGDMLLLALASAHVRSFFLRRADRDLSLFAVDMLLSAHTCVLQMPRDLGSSLRKCKVGHQKLWH